MKNVFFLIVLPMLLVTVGLGEILPARSNAGQAVNIKGCLGASDGNYTVDEYGTTQTFAITTSSTCIDPPTQVSSTPVILTPIVQATAVKMPEESSKIDAAIVSAVLALFIVRSKRSRLQRPDQA